jgi:hypothetical protein
MGVVLSYSMRTSMSDRVIARGIYCDAQILPQFFRENAKSRFLNPQTRLIQYKWSI